MTAAPVWEWPVPGMGRAYERLTEGTRSQPVDPRFLAACSAFEALRSRHLVLPIEVGRERCQGLERVLVDAPSIARLEIWADGLRLIGASKAAEVLWGALDATGKLQGGWRRRLPADIRDMERRMVLLEADILRALLRHAVVSGIAAECGVDF